MTNIYKNIIYVKKPPVAYITFNRPEKMNSFSLELQLEVKDALEDLGWKDKSIKVAVIKGAGKCFSTGFEILDEGFPDAIAWREHFVTSKGFATAFWDVFWDNPKPLIAQIHSYCIAGGMALASFCDLCICSEDALFGYPIIRDGGPYLHATWPYIFGLKKTMELIFTGNLIDAQEAWRLGLINRVVPKEKLDEEVNKLAQTVAKLPSVCNELNKRVVHMAYEMMNIRNVFERSSDYEAMCWSASAESHPERAEFKRIQEQNGLSAAFKWRTNKFADEDRWWKDKLNQAEEENKG